MFIELGTPHAKYQKTELNGTLSRQPLFTQLLACRLRCRADFARAELHRCYEVLGAAAVC